MSNNFVEQVIDLTNNIRSDAGLAPLQQDSELANAAQKHSKDMARQDFIGHEGSDGSSPFERIEDAGYEYSEAAENVAAGQATPEEVVESWMSSSGHRANILDASLQEIGVGFYYLKNDTGKVNYNSYWTQVFGTPLDGADETSTPSSGEENGDNVTLGVRDSRDALTGAYGSDNLLGSTGADLLTGGSGPSENVTFGVRDSRDALTGAYGSDNLVGSTGADLLTGGDLLSVPSALGTRVTAGDTITAADPFGTSQAASSPMGLDMASTDMSGLS